MSGTAIGSRLERAAASAWFAYGSILAIQLKVLWGIWEHRDLSPGDTSQYFAEASRWADSLHLDPLWSPVYTVFWGSLRWAVDDPYAVTILHRVLIAVGASLLVLAVMRRLLSPGIAWALAAWWAVLPINYDTLYEVHLFALLPELAAVLVALSWSGLRMRAAVFGILLATAALMRNEVIVAAVVWGAAWLVYELREHRLGRGVAWTTVGRAAAVPVLAVALLAALVAASYPDRGTLSSSGSHKHRINLCQIYAFGYEQRHDDYTASPWTECEPLMSRQFGRELPSLTQAVEANPGAMTEHFLWNARISPYAVQLMLFDRMSADARHSPDYAPVRAGSVAARFGVLLLIASVAGGLVLIWRARRRWWSDWIGPRAWGWLALGALGASAIAVMIWQRPRPSYLFALSVLILAVIGMAAMAYADRWPVLNRLRAAPPLLALLLILALPAHYGSGYETAQIGRPDRPLKSMVDRLIPFRERLRGYDVELLATYSTSACAYIGGGEPCTPVTWERVLNRPPGMSVRAALGDPGPDFIYVDELDLEDPRLGGAARAAEAAGWRRVAGESAGGDRWELIERPGSTAGTG